MNQNMKADCSRRQNAVKLVVKEILESLEIEEKNILDSVPHLSQALTSLDTQMALLALSEKFLGVSEIHQVLIHGITADKDSWMSNIGLKALVTACKSHAITVRDIALADQIDLYRNETIAEKIAQCLNIYEDVFEMVSCTQFYVTTRSIWPKLLLKNNVKFLGFYRSFAVNSESHKRSYINCNFRSR